MKSKIFLNILNLLDTKTTTASLVFT